MELSPLFIERNCIICGSNSSLQKYPAQLPLSITAKSLHSQYGSKGEAWWHYRVVSCRDCRHSFANPVFKTEMVENSYSVQAHDNEFGINSDVINKTNNGYVRLIEKYTAKSHRETLLDIGCDRGKFIKATQRLTFTHYTGIDPSELSIKEATHLPNTRYIHGFFNPLDFKENSFDLVTMIHVLDHLPDAGIFLKNLLHRLKPGGSIFVVVHNIHSFVALISGSSWHPFNLIHYDYYCKKSLRRLFEAAGYEVVAIRNTQNHLSLEQLVLRAPHLGIWFRQFLLTIIKKTPLNKLCIKLGLGNLAVIAKRTDK